MKGAIATSLGLLTAGATAAYFLICKRKKDFYSSLPVVKLKNASGMCVHISPMGAAITKILVPDKRGHLADVVLGYETIEQYMTHDPVTYFGVIVGRVANRIANAKFNLNGQEYTLAANNGPNALHGGTLGLHKRVWEVVPFSNDDVDGVNLHYTSPEGEEGYPGTLEITVTYRLAKHSNDLSVEIRATCDTATPVNIAQHSYFNLAGHNCGHNILDHVMHIPTGDHYTPVDDNLIPTGQIATVRETSFDFTVPQAIGDRIDQIPGGYDHNYVLFNQGPQARFITAQGVATSKPKLAATVKDPKTGRCMDVLTTAPGMQFYSGNFLDTNVQGKGHIRYFKHAGFCLETQGFPDSINQPNFPSIVIKPDEVYSHQVVYRFYNKQ